MAHSLGGLVVHRFLERYPDQPPGRVVLMGSPIVSSRAAVAIARVKWAARMVGRCVAEELFTERARHWVAGRDLGVIAGTKSMGLGKFFARFDEDCDGTVAVSETRVLGAADHLTLPVSHMGLLLSSRVARETGAFLKSGKFSDTSASRVQARSASRATRAIGTPHRAPRVARANRVRVR